MQNKNNKGNCVEGEGVYGNSILYGRFFCKPKAALKNIVY